MEFSRDGRLLVSGYGDKSVRIWDMETGTHKALLITDTAEVGDHFVVCELCFDDATAGRCGGMVCSDLTGRATGRGGVAGHGRAAVGRAERGADRAAEGT